MSTQILTPQDQTEAVELSGGRWRKQILPMTEIDYNGRKISFDRPYLASLVDSFKRKAYPQVPFQLANDQNQHTNDPERYRGELLDVELTADGLYGVFDINEAGAKVLEANPKLGVSARILEGFRRSDGQVFPKALQHVLGTLDPRVPGMKAWEKVELSNPEGDTIENTVDLSGETYKEDAMPKAKVGTAAETETVTIELSQEDAQTLQALLAQKKEDDKVIADLEAAVDGDPEDDEDEDGQGVDNEDGADDSQAAETAAMALAVADAQSAQILELTNSLRQASIEREIESLQRAGIVPAVVDAFRPLLGLPTGAVELSNGGKLDVGEAARNLLTTIVELSENGQSFVDLDVEIGLSNPADPLEAKRQAMLDQLDAEFGN